MSSFKTDNPNYTVNSRSNSFNNNNNNLNNNNNNNPMKTGENIVVVTDAVEYEEDDVDDVEVMKDGGNEVLVGSWGFAFTG
jgi:hypothetical protein